MAKTDKKRSQQRLGRGLSSIVSKRPAPSQRVGPSGDADKSTATTEAPEATRTARIDKIKPNPHQPRQRFAEDALQQLAESIKQHGLMQPLVVRPTEREFFQIIAGERRWRAAQQAGLQEVPVIIRDCSDQEALELALVENLQREDLNPIERARAYRQYMNDTGASVEQLAERVNQSRPNITNYLRLLNLDDEIQTMVSAGDLAMGQARAIAGIEDRDRQLSVAKQAIRRGLSTREVEKLAKTPDPQEPQEPKQQVEQRDVERRHFDEIEGAFSRAVGTAVNIRTGRRKNSGRIIIHYRNLDEFDRIAGRLGVNDQLEQ